MWGSSASRPYHVFQDRLMGVCRWSGSALIRTAGNAGSTAQPTHGYRGIILLPSTPFEFPVNQFVKPVKEVDCRFFALLLHPAVPRIPSRQRQQSG